MMRLNSDLGAKLQTLIFVALLAVGLVETTITHAFAGTWTTTGSMSNARLLHSATLLPNGQVLAAGGVNSTDFLSSTELYDPITGKWTSTGSMATPRGEHTATLLANGNVLVAGGLSNGNSLIDTACTATAELYNPASGQWTTTDSMTRPRGNRTATLLNDGTVLVTGGLCSGGFIYPDNSAELYEPSTGTWKATSSMNFARASAAATLLQGGEVLVAGGSGTSSCSTAELYNASNGRWRVTGSMNTPRASPKMTLLADGMALILGTSGLASYARQFYRPTNGTWHTIQYGVTPPIYGHTLTLLITGKALAAGGHFNNGITSLIRPTTPGPTTAL